MYFPVDVDHVETYGSLSVKLKSVDLVSHSDIVVRDFVLSLANRQVSSEIFHRLGAIFFNFVATFRPAHE